MAGTDSKHSVDETSPADDLGVPDCPSQTGFRHSIWKCLLLYPLATLPLGVGLLLAYWFPVGWMRATGHKCPLYSATYVILKDINGKECVEVVRRVEMEGSEEGATEDAKCSEKQSLLAARSAVLMYFEHRHLRFIYQHDGGRYVLLRSYEQGHTCEAIHLLMDGLSNETHSERLKVHGPNSMDVPVKSYHALFIEEVLHPFYVFQMLSVLFWFVDEYYYYSGCVLFISLLSVLVSLVQTRRYLKQLHDMVAFSCSVTVIRDHKEIKDVPGDSLVPGDVLVVPPSGMVMPCDAALLTGTAIVNESMLTGESVPVTKTPIPSDATPYNPTLCKRHTLFGGTQVIQTRFYSHSSVLAVVVRTGFYTAKGGMVRSILFPKPLTMKFYLDAIKFVLIMAVIAGVGVAYSITIFQVHHFEVKESVLRALDIITIAVPPALPAALTVGTVYALNRLRKQQIFCISPQRVNLCGKIKLVCFDKTGTLTEDSLDLQGVIPASGGSFLSLVEDPSELMPGPLLHAMATCHSLTTIDGEVRGDPLELKMFSSTKWVLQEPGDDCTRFDSVIPTIVHPPHVVQVPNHDQLLSDAGSTTATPTLGPIDIGGVELGIMRQFTFSSDLQRMSVMVKALPTPDPKLLHVYVKGAPETIHKLCQPSSIPPDFFQVLGELTKKGLRVLAVGHRKLHMPWNRAQRMQRSAVECELTFCGLLVMQNKLKPATTPTISTLMDADIRVVMVTGDNLLTAACVARECGMVDPCHRVIHLSASAAPSHDMHGQPSISYSLLGEGKDLCQGTTISMESNIGVTVHKSLRPFHLAIDGHAFGIVRQCFPELLPQLLVKGTIFARMSPDQKAQLVSDLQSLGYSVAMCGDGANDCGALKMAHAGISLSEAEASIASPFTSKVADISCVPKVIKEGRCALVTSFSVFKFMAVYSLIEFVTAAILYYYSSNLNDFEYIYVDLVIILSIAFVMGFTGPHPHLVKERPPGTLAGVHVVFSLLLQIALMIVAQVGALYYLKSQYWYVPFVPKEDSQNLVNSENTVLFEVANYQYIAVALVFSSGAPYRRPFWTNYWFVLCLLVIMPFNLYLTLAPGTWWVWLWDKLGLVQPPSLWFRAGIVELACLHFLLAYCIEVYILPTKWMKTLLRVMRCKRIPRNRYKHVLASLDSSWPPVQLESQISVN